MTETEKKRKKGAVARRADVSTRYERRQNERFSNRMRKRKRRRRKKMKKRRGRRKKKMKRWGRRKKRRRRSERRSALKRDFISVGGEETKWNFRSWGIGATKTN